MSSLATSPRMVRNAIIGFEKEVRGSPRLVGRLSYARAWYACRDVKGRWRFGPSKFVGYERLTAPEYIELSRRSLDGRRTEAQLRQWFRELDPLSELHERLAALLSAFLAQHDKVPSSKMRINVFDEDYRELVEDHRDASGSPILDLIVAVAESLPRRELNQLRSRLTAISP